MTRWIAALVVVLVGCSSKPESTDAGWEPDGSLDASTDLVWHFTVSPDGGLLVAGKLSLDIPPGAVATPTDLTVRERPDAVVPGHERLSSLYVFEPEGLRFVQDVPVAIALDDGAASGALWWSTASGADLEVVGLASAGLAEGYVNHFSQGVVSKKKQCIEPDGPGRTECMYCRATDGQDDALSKGGVDAGCGDWPPSNSPWTGREGAPCSGYGLRTRYVTRCACKMRTTPFEYLCARPFVTFPAQRCPVDGGLQGYVDVGNEGGRCSGYRVDNTQANGSLVDCAPEAVGEALQRVNGQLEGCSNTNPEIPGGYALCDGSEAPRNRTSQACAELLSQPNAGKTACRTPDGSPLTPSEAGSLGTRGGAFIEDQLFSGPNQLTQLEVPNASKDDCAGMSGRPGYPDLVQVVSGGDTGPIQVRVGDVKPLTNSGVSKGRADLHNCYFDAVDRAGAHCAETPVPPEYRAFCAALGSDGGRPVVVDRSGSVGFSPGEFCGPSVLNDGGPPQRYVGYECGPGITAFRCAE